jgi:hypothetical protein
LTELHAVQLWPNVADAPTIRHGTILQTKEKLQVVTARRRKEEASKQASKQAKKGNRNLLQNALRTTLRSSFFLCGCAPAAEERPL